MDTLLLTFLVKEKSVPVWAAQAHETKRLMKLSLEEEAERFYTLLRSFVSLPLRISTSSILHWGSREGATPSLCRRSRNQKVPCVSLPTFFTQESRRGSGVRNPTKRSERNENTLHTALNFSFSTSPLPCRKFRDRPKTRPLL